MATRLLILLLGIAAASCVAAGPSAGSELRVEYSACPVPVSQAIDTPYPRFSWTIPHTDRAQYQTAYRLTVTTYDSKPVWDSGKVPSAQHTLVPYKGQPLTTGSYAFTVSWYDANGNAAPVSAPGTFEMGILDARQWDNAGAVWIASRNDSGNLFRSEFSIGAGLSVKRARAYVCGLGWHEVHVNGKRVSFDALAPGWTRWNRRVLYLVYDVTSVLVAGSNAVGVMLGKGWRDLTPFPNRNGDTPAFDTRSRVLRMFVLADLSDGRTNVVVSFTDASWRETPGPITSDSVYDGESYDARLEQFGWDQPLFANASAWAPVLVTTGPGGVLSSQSMPGMRVSKIYNRPISVGQPRPNMFVADFGQNFAGWCQITIRGCTTGLKVQLRFAEILNIKDPGMIWTENLRGAKATDTYTCKSNGTETYTPRFTYHGFRFVEITGYPGFADYDLQAQHFHSALPSRSDTTFSSEMLNRINSAVIWGQRSNLMSVPTDCDQRDERLGWMGDAALSAEAFMTNFDHGGFWTNFLRNIADEQGTDGSLPDTVPFVRYGGRPADPGWSAAYPQLVWSMWKYEGDTDIIDVHFDGLKKYLGYVAAQVATTGLANMYVSYGDWVPPPPNRPLTGACLSSYYYLLNVGQILEMAQATGRTSDVTELTALLTSLRQQFNTAWFNSDEFSYDTGAQSALSVALLLDVVPKDSVDNVVVNLLNDLVTKHNTHMTTGISGIKAMTQYLPHAAPIFTGQTTPPRGMGRSDIALTLTEQVDYPSWGWMLVNGKEPATTIWELMDAPEEGSGMNSRNHHMYSSVGQMINERFGGIANSRAGTGYSEVVMHAAPALGLSAASQTVRTQRGKFQFTWQRHGGIQCAKAVENTVFTLDCGAKGGLIQTILFASWGTPTSQCGLQGTYQCHADGSAAGVQKACFGQRSCSFIPTNDMFGGDPCSGTQKWLSVTAKCGQPSQVTALVTVPPSSVATVRLPYYRTQSLTVTEGSTVVAYNGSFVPGVTGVVGAAYTGGAVAIAVQSGTYNLAIQGSDGARVCVKTNQGEQQTLSCPDPKTVITYVSFASFGRSDSECTNPVLKTGNECNHGSSMAVVEGMCIGKNTCTIHASDSVFGLACTGQKHLLTEVFCGVL